VWLLLFLLYYLNKGTASDSIKKPTKGIDYGVYFMDLSTHLSKCKENRNEFSEIKEEFYYVLGCASQGRTDEIKEFYKSCKTDNITLLQVNSKF